jgi:hypothetical protein
MSDTPETDTAERMAFAQEQMVPTEVARKLERERNHYRDAILTCLEENAHLADGEDCTLIGLKRALLAKK